MSREYARYSAVVLEGVVSLSSNNSNFAQVVDGWEDTVGLKPSPTFGSRPDRPLNNWQRTFSFFPNADSHVLGDIAMSPWWLRFSQGDFCDSNN